MRFGSGEFVYELIEGWGQLPDGWEIIDASGIAIDSQDRIYVFNRGEHPMIVFDRDGKFLTSWGEDIFGRPHAVRAGPDDSLYCVDYLDHTVRKCTTDGKVLMTIGTPHQQSDTGFIDEDFRSDFLSVKRGAGPFNHPTNVGLSPEGDIYVSDGYGNARVHKFSPSGELLRSWGEPGTGPGEFHLPHGVCVDEEGVVYVSDRMNSRIQLFTPDGEFISQWNDVYRGCDVYYDGAGHVYTAEFTYDATLPMSGPRPPGGASTARVTVRTRDGEILSSITGPDPRAPGNFHSPHAVMLDSRGDLYVGEVSATAANREGVDRKGLHTVQKFARVRG